MEINKLRYKVLESPRKVYFDIGTLELREKLNKAFAKPISEDDMTGIIGKYIQRVNRCKIKYIYTRNKQLQPQTYDRYYYLLDVGADEKGTYIEYVMVYDKLVEPLIRLSYILTALLIIGCFVYLSYKDAMSKFSVGMLSIIIVASMGVLLKKPKENAEKCKMCEKIIEKVISNF